MTSWVSGHDRARDLLSMVFYHLLDKSPKIQTINADFYGNMLRHLMKNVPQK